MRIRSALCGFIAVVTIVAGILDARPAIAQEEQSDPWSVAPGNPADFSRAGAFVGLGFNWQVPGFQGPFQSEDYGNSLGLNARGGYRFYDWLAAEAIIEYANDFSPRAPGTTADSISLLSTTVNGKLILPLERFQPYLEGGLGLLRADTGNSFAGSVNVKATGNNVGFIGRIGAGIDFYLTRHVSVFVDNSWTMSTKDAYFYSLGGGARWNF
jgi:opacity protein-like surface antigen